MKNQQKMYTMNHINTRWIKFYAGSLDFYLFFFSLTIHCFNQCMSNVFLSLRKRSYCLHREHLRRFTQTNKKNTSKERQNGSQMKITKRKKRRIGTESWGIDDNNKKKVKEKGNKSCQLITLLWYFNLKMLQNKSFNVSDSEWEKKTEHNRKEMEIKSSQKENKKKPHFEANIFGLASKRRQIKNGCSLIDRVLT